MKVYLNVKTNGVVETIDELDSKDFKNTKEFTAEYIRLRGEYQMSGQDAYISPRCTKDWRES